MNLVTVNDCPVANVCDFVSEEVHFGFGIEPAVNQYLQKAASTVSSYDSALDALNKARSLAPNRLEVLLALYKFHCYRGDINKAEEIVFQTLVKASVAGDFPYDWDELHPQDADWSDPRSPARIYLYSLKALAFIRLKQQDMEDAGSILKVLQYLDPDDLVGASVLRQLLLGMEDEADD